MGETKGITRVGFWCSSAEPGLPMPVENPKPWGGQVLFLRNLLNLQDDLTATMYRGSSTCRICKLYPNGYREYNHGGFVWPEGLAHYVEKHNVVVPQSFFDFIVRH